MPSMAILAPLSIVLSAAWSLFGFLLRRAAGQILTLRERIETGPGRGPTEETATGDFPTLSVVVTARDEAEAIETTIRHLLAQRYPGIELIAVDDRSTDATGEILDRMKAKAGASRLTVIHVRDLPRGWLGKCHACHLGSVRARGTWILFLDGDVQLKPEDLLARVIALAERSGLDHLAVIPDLRPVSPLQQAFLTVFAQMYFLAGRVYEMDRDRMRGGVGIGAFNLVRRSSYDRIGGHSLLKMDPGDDYKLGRLLKESGARQRLMDGIDLVRCRWHRGALNAARGLEKNLFSGFDYSVFELLGFSLLVIGFMFGPPVGAALGFISGLSSGSSAWILTGAAPLVLQAFVIGSALRHQTARHGGSAVALGLLYPAAVLLLLAAAWNSAFRTIRRGGVRWRDTFYPLAELRAGRVRAGAGRRRGVL